MSPPSDPASVSLPINGLFQYSLSPPFFHWTDTTAVPQSLPPSLQPCAALSQTTPPLPQDTPNQRKVTPIASSMNAFLSLMDTNNVPLSPTSPRSVEAWLHGLNPIPFSIFFFFILSSAYHASDRSPTFFKGPPPPPILGVRALVWIRGGLSLRTSFTSLWIS